MAETYWKRVLNLYEKSVSLYEDISTAPIEAIEKDRDAFRDRINTLKNSLQTIKSDLNAVPVPARWSLLYRVSFKAENLAGRPFWKWNFPLGKKREKILEFVEHPFLTRNSIEDALTFTKMFIGAMEIDIDVQIADLKKELIISVYRRKDSDFFFYKIKEDWNYKIRIDTPLDFGRGDDIERGIKVSTILFLVKHFNDISESVFEPTFESFSSEEKTRRSNAGYSKDSIRKGRHTYARLGDISVTEIAYPKKERRLWEVDFSKFATMPSEVDFVFLVSAAKSRIGSKVIE